MAAVSGSAYADGQQTGVRAWGENAAVVTPPSADNELLAPPELSALELPELGDVVSLAGGEFHALVAKSDGTVWAWGRNDSGQLSGTGEGGDVPRQVRGLPATMAVAVAAGADHSLAILDDGSVWAWGRNDSGQLGDGTTRSNRVPVLVAGLSGAVEVAAGRGFSLAVLDDGTVWAWGRNQSGQLGDGSSVELSTKPVKLPLTNVVAVAAGGEHGLALCADGTVFAWGSGAHGQLGNGSFDGSRSPVRVSGLGGVEAIATGELHSLALGDEGKVFAWGENGSGQLGDGTRTAKNVPVAVVGLAQVDLIATGSMHNLALLHDGTVRAWGENSHGQLGDGSYRDRATAVEVSRLFGVVQISAGGTHSFALRGAVHADLGLTQIPSRGRVKSGENISYTLSVSNVGPKLVNDAILVDLLPSNATFVGASHGCTGPAVGTTGRVSCPLGPLVAGGKTQVKIVVRAAGGAGATMENRAWLALRPGTVDHSPADNRTTHLASIPK
jgi:uncharacterized repeat protein (TIGR01451 family)